MPVKSVMPSSHLILCHPLLFLPPIPPSIRVFSTLRMRWPKYWSFSFSISPSSEHPGMISFRMDWLDLLAVQGTLRSLLHHSSKAPVFRCSAFFTGQLSHPYMTTGNTIALPYIKYMYIYMYIYIYIGGFTGGSDGKESASNSGYCGLIPGLGKSSGEGNGNLLQFSCLENPMDRRVWWAAVHGVTQSWT